VDEVSPNMTAGVRQGKKKTVFQPAPFLLSQNGHDKELAAHDGGCFSAWPASDRKPFA
jgi:hypothetical protein